jgi:hypothetical protein
MRVLWMPLSAWVIAFASANASAQDASVDSEHLDPARILHQAYNDAHGYAGSDAAAVRILEKALAQVDQKAILADGGKTAEALYRVRIERAGYLPHLGQADEAAKSLKILS